MLAQGGFNALNGMSALNNVNFGVSGIQAQQDLLNVDRIRSAMFVQQYTNPNGEISQINIDKPLINRNNNNLNLAPVLGPGLSHSRSEFLPAHQVVV